MTESSAQERRFQRIVVGVDGTPSSIAALRWAVGLAEVSGSTVTALMGWLPNVAYGYPDVHYVRDSYRRVFADAVASVEARTVTIESRFLSGSPADLLVEASGQADLLVLGARRHHGVVGLFLGSVSGHVLAHAHCPVVVVPEPPAGFSVSITDATEAVPV